MFRPAAHAIPADVISQQALDRQLMDWWDELTLGERLATFRVIAAAEVERQEAEERAAQQARMLALLGVGGATKGHPRRDDDPVHVQ